jgi:hypothetical protein
MPIQKKMYILVRNDLAEKYCIVQGSHALAQYAIDHKNLFLEWNNRTIVFLGVRNLKELRKWLYLLEETRKDFSTFDEPDLDDQLTSIACYDTGEIFKGLKTA